MKNNIGKRVIINNCYNGIIIGIDLPFSRAWRYLIKLDDFDVTWSCFESELIYLDDKKQ